MATAKKTKTVKGNGTRTTTSGTKTCPTCKGTGRVKK